MWAHQPWVGRFLSPQRRGRELEEYATWCNSVEGNTTFYAEPSEATIARWAEQAPADFRFAFKLPRSITHEHRLVGADSLIASFLRRIEPLEQRIGPVQIQLPPSFAPTSIVTLEHTLRSLPREFSWAVEFRHAGFFDGLAADRVDSILGELGIGRVVLDTRPLYSSPPRSDASLDERRTKPRLPIRPGPPSAHPIVRVIGADDRGVTLDGLTTWSDQMLSWLDEGREPYLFVHQPENLDSPALARETFDHIGGLVDGRTAWRLTPLPEPIPVAPRSEIAGQDRLF